MAKKISVKKQSKPPKLPQKIISYLEKAGVPHELIEHKTVYTAYDAAQTMGKKLSEIAKSLLVKADKDYYVAILPADHNVDFSKLGKNIGKLKGKDVKVVKIPGEKIVQDLLKLKNETVSAFGQAYKLPVIVDKALSKSKQAIFASGGFNHSVQMAVKDFLNLEKAGEGSFGIKKAKKQENKKTKRKSGRK
jgi:prolyl-tRNA editing enzyme YbaK/EbsC (Cys-tRNA(Pro) deacylase)